MLFGMLTLVRQKNNVLDRGPDPHTWMGSQCTQHGAAPVQCWCQLGCTRWGCTLAPAGEYDWTVHMQPFVKLLLSTWFSFSIFTAEGRRPQNDAQVLSSSSGLLLLLHTPPVSSRSSLLYHLPIVSLARLPLPLVPSRWRSKMCVQSFCAVIMCPKYCNFHFFTVASSSLSMPISFSTDSLFYAPSNWFAACVCNMSSRRLSACQRLALRVHDSLPYDATGHTSVFSSLILEAYYLMNLIRGCHKYICFGLVPEFLVSS